MINFNKKIFIYFLFITSLLISYFIGENSSGGAKADYYSTNKYIEAFKISINYGLELFFKDQQLHFPFFYILISFLDELFGNLFLHILYLLISSLIPVIFYKVLKKKFPEANIDILFFLSLIIFLSPYFRSSAVWITTDNLALLFFMLSINSYVIFEKDKKNYLKRSFLCFFFLILASYIRHYYSLFFFFYLILMQPKLNLKENFFIIIFNLIFSIPALVYVFFFIKNISISGNFHTIYVDYIFSILIFFSLYFFYFMPFFLNLDVLKKFKNEFKEKKNIIFLMIFLTLALILFYEIPDNIFGGGVLYKLSKLVYLEMFFLFSFMGLLFFYIFNGLIFRNYFLFLILIIAFPFEVIYQKYYDPLMIISFLTLTSSIFLSQIISEMKKTTLLYIYCYFLFFLISTNIYYISE